MTRLLSPQFDAKITVQPTRKGVKEIDESHACYTFKYLKNKPVGDLCDDQFLKIVQAEAEGLLRYEMHINVKDRPHDPRIATLFDEVEPVFHRDEFSNLIQEWNNWLAHALKRVLNLILLPQMIKELERKLLDEAKESVTRACCRKLYNWLKVAPYKIDKPMDRDGAYLNSWRDVTVIGIGIQHC